MQRLRVTMIVLTTLGACGDDSGSAADAAADARNPDAGVDAGVDARPPCLERSGYACTWLGIPGEVGYNGDGHHRLETRIYWSMDLLFGTDGTPWFIDWNNHLLRKVNADQTIETVVGWNDPIFPGDGTGDATERSPQGADGNLVKLNHPTDLALGTDGSILMMAWHNHKLRSIDPASGNCRILAGAGAGFAGDAMPYASAIFKQPKSLDIDTDGNIYIGDQQNFRVRKIDHTTGLINTIVGVGTQGSGGDGGPALAAQLNWEIGSNPEPSGGLAVGGGKLYIADTLSHKVRVVDLTTNLIDTLAGTGEEGYSGDDGPALAATLAFPRDLELGPDGDLYIADTDNHAIRAVNLTTRMIRTVAGTGEGGLDPTDGLLATETKLARPFGIQFDPDGNLYIMDTINSRIVKVTR